MNPFFKELFEYNYHFNQKLVDIFKGNSNKVSEKSVKLFSHIIDAHQIWNNRIAPKERPYGVWEIQAIRDFKKINESNYEYSLSILDKLNLSETFHYANSKGQTFESKIKDALFHIINHSTYHRGQIATEFRNSGLEPLVTDYVFYKRG